MLSNWYRRGLAAPRYVIIGIVLSVVMLSALSSIRIHRMEVHLRRVHYARWVEGNAVVAHATDDSASTRVRYDSKPAVVVLIEPKAEPKTVQEVTLEPSVPLNRLLLQFKLGLRSSSDSDPLL